MPLGRSPQNEDGLKLKETHQLMVYTHDVNVLGEIIKIIKIMEPFFYRSAVVDLAVNTEKSTHVSMFHVQNAGQNQNITLGNKFFGSVAKFKYLGMTQIIT
jgi:hypothetical protein